MNWVTRKHIRVNRTATAWLIRRFLDPDATFSFLEPNEVAAFERQTGAIGFDAPKARYPHEDGLGRCSFEALVAEHLPSNPALKRLALIVRSADLPAASGLTAEGAGLRAISQGFPLVSQDDQETVEKAAFMYDALYAYLEQQQSAG